jgi:stearoyl-CoA desaturase (delta-9 desaturase)
MSLQGGVIDWVADHRKHHTFTDEDGDPHSPHAGHGAGLGGMLAGLWHAHVGWLFETHGQASSKRFAPDLVQDATMRRINRSFPLIALGSLALPFVLGVALSGGSLVDGGLSALLWAGLVRIFLVHHITWSINSICHFFGSRRFDTDDQSTNVFWLALPSLGEAWHHNHHAFPQSAFHGLRWYELDP